MGVEWAFVAQVRKKWLCGFLWKCSCLTCGSEIAFVDCWTHFGLALKEWEVRRPEAGIF